MESKDSIHTYTDKKGVNLSRSHHISDVQKAQTEKIKIYMSHNLSALIIIAAFIGVDAIIGQTSFGASTTMIFLKAILSLILVTVLC